MDSKGYGSEAFYRCNKVQFPKLIRGLISTRANSSYVDKVSMWTLEDNDDIVKYDDFGNLATYIMFFANFCKFTQDFIDKYKVEKYHIKLIRRMWFEYIDEINLDFKRPYGNSNILNDVKTEYMKATGYNEKDESKLIDIHMRTLELFDLALEELYMSTKYEKIGNEWITNKSYYRINKLERILK